MKMLATTTVIRGKGACEAYMNGIMNAEIEKMNELHRQEMEAVINELQSKTNRENDLLAEKLPKIRAYTSKRSGVFSDVLDKFEVAWAFVWYMGLKFKLWCDDRNSDDIEGGN